MEPQPADKVSDDVEWSMFQVKYDEFVEDALGALPEYKVVLEAARSLSPVERLERFQSEVKQVEQKWEEKEESVSVNPKTILPGVVLTDEIWNSLSDGTRRAIWEYIRVLSICAFMESGHMGTSKPEWMDDMMKDIKEKWESVDMDSFIHKFSSFFSSSSGSSAGSSASSSSSSATPSGDEKEPSFSFPKLPERFLKGQLAKLAQEIVKDITPEDLGISPDMVAECEKNPTKAFGILFSTFTKQPGMLQKTIAKIGKRLQQKIVSGAIRPQEIAREAEELMKEFSNNSSFVEMMESLKSAFGMEDMDMARAAGKESSARLATVRDRLRKKLEKRQAAQAAQASSPHPAPKNKK
jgi:hypothetical protein